LTELLSGAANVGDKEILGFNQFYWNNQPMNELHKKFKKIEPVLTVLLWPLMLQITLKTFAKIDVHYVLCLIGEFTLFGFCRIIGLGLGITKRSSSQE